MTFIVTILKRPAALLLAAALAVSACSTPATRGAVNDPLEGLNRISHGINKGADTVILRPTSHLYGHMVPQPVRKSVDNFAANLSQPSFVLNDVMQGRIDDAGHNLFRFLINTTVGLGGLFDPAKSFGLDERRSDFGETLYTWGVGEGVYIELPLLGPSTGRDAVGRLVDFSLDPIGQLTMTVPERQALNKLRFAEIVGDRFENGRAIDALLYDSADSYSQFRSFYLQNRRFTLMGPDGQSALSPDLDPFNDPFAVPVSP